jgi:putative acetyltransferase
MKIRPAQTKDLNQICSLFKETVRTICIKDYSKQQIEAWSSAADNKIKWQEKIETQISLVAEEDDKILGIGSLKGGNYIDLFYVHKDFQGIGIATRILQELENKSSINESILYSDVSKTAKSFFEKHGYITIKQQNAIVKNVSMINYRMEKNKSSLTSK